MEENKSLRKRAKPLALVGIGFISAMMFVASSQTFAVPWFYITTALAASWGSITGDPTAQTDMIALINAKANIASPTFTGTLTAATVTATGNMSLTTTNAGFSVGSNSAFGYGGYFRNDNGLFMIWDNGSNTGGYLEKGSNGEMLLTTGSSGRWVTLGSDNKTKVFSAQDGRARLLVSESPASNATCKAGAFTFDTSFFYICKSTDTWARVAITGGY